MLEVLDVVPLQMEMMSHQRRLNNKSSLTVGIIGGGIAGLQCAATLKELGHHPTVFDTGRLRPGGRCSSRLPGDKPKNGRQSKDTILGSQIIDHAAQIIVLPSSRSESSPSSSSNSSKSFEEQVLKWCDEGILSKYPDNSVVEILSPSNNNNSSSMAANSTTSSFRIKYMNSSNGGNNNNNMYYYGSNGMGAIPLAITNEASLDVQQDVWVSPSNGVKYLGNNSPSSPSDNDHLNNKIRWLVKAKGERLGEFDRLVIAHNGKCADRLMSSTPAKKLHSLLRTNFAPTVPAGGGKRMTLNSIYSLSFAVDCDSPLCKSLPENVISAFIKNERDLRFLSNNTRKYKSNRSKHRDKSEVWTLLSSSHFAKKYKAPQENIPSDVQEEVTTLMIEGLERSLGLEKDSIKPMDSKLQLWGAAVPINTWADCPGFLFDNEFGVGACGDWLLEPSVSGAWQSGKLLAEWIDKCNSKDNGTKPSSLSVGLPPGNFKANNQAQSAGIASFPSVLPHRRSRHK